MISPSPEWQVQPQLGVEEGVVTTEKTTEKILCIIKNNPRVTYRELAEALAVTEDGIYWSVKQLRKQGLLHRIGGRKGGFWQVQTQ